MRRAKLDNIDREVVRLLQQDGRMSTCEIARRLHGISDRAIRFRLERLRQSNVVYVTALLNTSRLGLPVMGDVLLEIMPWKYEETVSRLMADDRVCYIAASSDRTQISIQINGHDTAELMATVGQVIKPLDGVTEVSVAPLTTLIRDVSKWVLPAEE